MNVSGAKSALAEAEARAKVDSADVDRCREAVAAGEPGAAGELSRSQKRLSRAIEAREQARAAIRVAERREEADRAQRAAEAERVRRELLAILTKRRDTKLDSFRIWARGVAADGAEYDRELRDLKDQIGSGLVPSELRAWREWTAAMAEVIRAVEPIRPYVETQR